MIKSFYSSSLLLDVLCVFGELSEENVQHRKYARWKATCIHNCLKNGETPQSGPIGMEDGEAANPPCTWQLSLDALKEPDSSELRNHYPECPLARCLAPNCPVQQQNSCCESSAIVRDTLEVDPEILRYRFPQSRSVTDWKLFEVFVQTHNPEMGGGVLSADLQANEKHWEKDFYLPELISLRENAISRIRPQRSNMLRKYRDLSPAMSMELEVSPIMGLPSGGAHLPGPHNTNYNNIHIPPGAHAPANTPAEMPPASEAAKPVPVPRSVPLPVDPRLMQGQQEGVNLTADDFTKAQKLCKYAGSALQYEDVSTAVTNLQQALRLLTTGHE
ncbi:Vacuolar protein sorting-associated protein VTA1 like [Dissostichus eleginoides]|uniref:Vacuolar protein sorting-associated protein VTA1 like n=1 Tax=Dissostichus eleginoides TaxID=100907 RepID=A0AAD9BSV4_DISEL|nr:Vacuolar protein sorting-associated protein VTA1 like [Dissostichus eleginoides]